MDAKHAAELADLDAIGQAALAASGELSAVELLDAAITRTEATRGLNAVITDLFERGRDQAAALDQSGSLRTGAAGPLAGVPFLLKDLGASLAGAREAMGSRALRSHVATQTAWIVERYLAAGLVVFGKTNTPEWGNHCTTEPSLFGRTANPWSPDITPGGSSGGSAAAVAAGVVPAASGGDGTGSIRVPAACCGLVGLKPRRARTSFAPSGHLLEGLAVEHALTRTVRDSAALLDAVTGGAPGDPYNAPLPAQPFLTAVGQPPPPQRILIATHSPFPAPQTDPRVVAAVETAGRALESIGHHVEPGSARLRRRRGRQRDRGAAQRQQCAAVQLRHIAPRPRPARGRIRAQQLGDDARRLHHDGRRLCRRHRHHPRPDPPVRRRHGCPRRAAGPDAAGAAAALWRSGSAPGHHPGVLRRRVRPHRLDDDGQRDRLGGHLACPWRSPRTACPSGSS